MSKIIIVSNRLPVNVKREDKGYTLTPSAGGLVTGLSSIFKEGNGVWVGWPGLNLKTDRAKEAVTRKLQAENMHPVFIPAALFDKYYAGFSNDTIWPLFHYFPTMATMEPEYWEAYKQANQLFCDEIVKLAEEGDTIWVHDYHLFLLPELLRNVLPDLSIGFFQHIPFPSYEIFRVLPWRDELLRGVVEADLVGFHTYDDMRHFLSSVSRILGYHHTNGLIDTGNHLAQVDAFPMGIDYDKYAENAASPAVSQKVKELDGMMGGKKLILSVDRLDISKGIPEKLKAYELFLQENPQYHGHCEMMLVVVPSRTQVEAYQLLKTEIEQEVGRINGLFSHINWNPIQYLYRPVDFDTLSAFYRKAEVAFITSLRDGMNLVAKEYLASKTDGKGVLIISEMAGASKELSDALIINPNNIQQMAGALKQALEMKIDEQQLRNRTMQYGLKRNNVKRWAEMFISKLYESSEVKRKRDQQVVDRKIIREISERFAQSKSRLLIMGFDGTLVPFAKELYSATPDEEVHEILMELAMQHNTEIVIASGRSRQMLEEWLKGIPLAIICEHGALQKEIGEDWLQLTNADTGWKQDLISIFQDYADRTPGTFVEEKDFSMVWHYRRADVDFGRMRANELINHLQYLISNKDLQILEGTKTVEVKHASVNKGNAVNQWISKHNFDFILSCGADNTFEEVFHALKDRAINIKVGQGHTEAGYIAKNHTVIRQILKSMIAAEASVQDL